MKKLLIPFFAICIILYSVPALSQCPDFNEEQCLSAIFSNSAGNWKSRLDLCIEHDDFKALCENYIYRNGPVAVGRKDVPSGFNLAITGGFAVSRVGVELCRENGWCDYVFDKDYNLPSLYDVKNHILEYKRLPKFKSEEEIVKSGINVGEIKILQQEKIEELFLYVIDLDNRIKNLK